MPDTNPNNPAPQVDTADLTARTMQQAKAELPQPKAPALSDALAEPAPAAPSTSKIGKAYDAMKSWLGEHEENLSEKHLAPFRQGLDNMAADLEEAGESGHTKSGGALSGPTRALASGAGFMLRQVPVGKNAKETAAMALAPELPEGHMFEGLRVRPLEQIGEEVAEKSAAKSITKNASGESAASQEAINRAVSQKSQGVTHVRRDTRSGKEIPMSSVDATDAKAGPYDQIVQKHANGETILDSGAKARPVSGQPKTAGAQVSPKPFAKSEDKKEVSKLASDYLVTLKKSVN